MYRAGNRRLAEINKIDNQNARLGHTINYYIELLTNATAMAEYKESARRARAEDRGLDSAITITRQEVLLDKCQFINNTLGITKQLGSNNGVISISSNSNDVTINKCIFRNNQLNDINIAVGYLFLEVELRPTTSVFISPIRTNTNIRLLLNIYRF